MLGLLLPYLNFVPWLVAYWLDVPRLFEEAGATPVTTFAWLDVVITTIVVIGFIVFDRRERTVPFANAAIVGTFLVGPSFGLPMYLLLREVAKDLVIFRFSLEQPPLHL